MDKIEEILTRGVANIVPGREELEKQLRSGKKLNIYAGFDPTATRLHLGHAVPFRKLKALADLGHNVTFLIGDFTALIGDTSDKESERPALTEEEIKENFKTYKEQASKILDFSKVNVVFNSEWLNKLNFNEVIKLCQHFSIGDFISRELIRKRLDEGKRVVLHEVLYPIAQGYDHYHLDADLQIGATEQTFNLQAGRTLLKALKGKESSFLTLNILEGTDGRRMSKTWGNAIWLEDNANDMYAKVMAIKDDLIIQYFTLATDIPLDQVNIIKERLENGDNPMLIKKELARQIVTELHSKEAAEEAAHNFTKTVQQKEMPAEIPTIEVKSTEPLNITDALISLQMAESKSEAKRLIEQGGVEINDKRLTNPNEQIVLEDNMVIKVGKRKFVKIKIINTEN